MPRYQCRQCGKELSWNGFTCSKECSEKFWTKKLDEHSQPSMLTTHCCKCGKEIDLVAMKTPQGTMCDDCYYKEHEPIPNTYLSPEHALYVKNKRSKPMPTKKIKYCQYCGNEFKEQRSTKKFCSDACKVAFHRMPETISKQAEIIKDSIETMYGCFRRDERLADDYDKLLSEIQLILIERRKEVNHVQKSLFDEDNKHV